MSNLFKNVNSKKHTPPNISLSVNINYYNSNIAFLQNTLNYLFFLVVVIYIFQV